MQTKVTKIWFGLSIWMLSACLGCVDLVEAANAPALLLANEFGPKFDPAKYLVSEKYDGVRAVWDGKVFLIGTGFTDEMRRRPPPVGTTITDTYRGLTNTALPRFASYLRVRENF